MNCRQFVHILELLCPPEHAENWDNPGLLVGDYSKEIHRVLIALDATTDVVRQAIDCGADLILTHHPLIFSGLKKINSDDMTGRRVVEMLKHDICCYAMHTNFDVDVMGDIATEMLGLSEVEILEVTGKKFLAGSYVEYGIGTFGILPKSMTLRECAEYVKETFDIEDVRVFGNLDAIVRTAAVCPGSGKDLVEDACRKHADVYISGDFGHHNGIDANEEGVLVIDAGHQGIEKIFIDYMKHYIEGHIEGVEVITENSRPPFVTV